MALLLIIVLIPVIEITLFIKVGGAIGAMATVLLTLVTAFTGVSVMKSQGMSQISKLQNRVSSDKFPGQELLASVCILFGGILLLLPGFFTDSLGLLLLLPPVQGVIFAKLKASPDAVMRRDFSGANFFMMQSEETKTPHKKGREYSQSSRTTIIDAEYQKIEDDEADK